MSKSPDAFRTISEVADWLGVQAHVLRFWESKFSHVKPVKRAGGRRYYRPSDMQLLGGIKQLLHDDGLTIKGVQKILREQGVGHVSNLSQSLEEGTETDTQTSQQDATVLRFRASEPAQDDAPAEDPDGAVKGTEPEDATPAPAVDETPPAAIATDPEPEPVVADSPEPEPVAATAPDNETDVPDAPPAQPTLPSFMHRRGMDAQPTDTGEVQTPPAARARTVDAPDPPAEQDLPYSPGILAKLAGLDQLSPGQAQQLVPVVQDLRTWMNRASAPGMS